MVSVLAQLEPGMTPHGWKLSDIGDNWGGGRVIPIEWLLMAIGLMLLVVGAVSFHAWWRTRHLRAAPWWTFHRLGALFGLTVGERFLLQRIARQQGLSTPVALMLSPVTLRVHARAYADARGAAGKAELMRRIARLRHKLFTDPV